MKNNEDSNRSKRYVLKLVFVFTVLLLSTDIINASKYITVATIGNQVPVVDKTMGMQTVVEEVIRFWQMKLKQVLPDNPDLIVLPEYCDFPKGFSARDESEYLTVRKNQIQDFFASEAKKNHCYIAFGMKRQDEKGIWRNSCIIVGREGNIIGIYDKNFPTISDMDNGVSPSKYTPLIKCDFGTVGCVLCFDLNFDELRRVYVELKPDIIVFPSQYHGGLVQSYWAYTCRSFFVSSMAFREIPSEIRNPLGEIIASSTNYFDFTAARINLDHCFIHLDNNRAKLVALKKKYGAKVIITDPGKLGLVMVTSENDKISAADMIKEFEIELADDYFNRSRNHRLKQVKQ